MKYVQFTVRVRPSHFRLLSSLAERRKMTRYKMLGHVISKGLEFAQYLVLTSGSGTGEHTLPGDRISFGR